MRAGKISIRFATAALAAGLMLPAATSVSAATMSPGSTSSSAPQQKKKTTAKKQTQTQAQRNAARRRAAARARQAAAERALKEAMTPRYRTDAAGNTVPDVRAEAAIVFNPNTGEVLWEENSRAPRSIASITKVMTAIVFMADEPNLDEFIRISQSDVTRASVTYLRAGERVRLGDVLHLALVASDNGAARALARTSEGGTQAFVARMNEKAGQLGLQSTRFAEPSGLDANNISTAYDVSHLISFAANDPTIGAIMAKETHKFYTDKRAISIKSTNKLLGNGYSISAAKTGFTSKAGFCLATLMNIPDTNDQIAVVVLGAKSSVNRFWETRHLFNWVKEKASELFHQQPVR